MTKFINLAIITNMAREKHNPAIIEQLKLLYKKIVDAGDNIKESAEASRELDDFMNRNKISTTLIRTIQNMFDKKD